MKTRAATVGAHCSWITKYTTRAEAIISSDTRSRVESRKAPALVGPTPARATAPSSASQTAATPPTTTAHTKWPVMMRGTPTTCSSRPI